jgi:hypothetical protein
MRWKGIRVSALGLTIACAILLSLTAPHGSTAQIVSSSGQDIAPAYEGWEENPDGTFTLVFGYFNRNWDEEFDIPVGPDNSVDPGGSDQGQPTHFLPRRNRFVFRITVPADFAKKEIVSTLTSHGKTNRAYATLKLECITDPQLQEFDVGDFGHNNRKEHENKAPVVTIDGEAHRTVRVGEPLTLTALATDDGIPKPQPAPLGTLSIPPGRRPALGLKVAWFVFRGPAKDVTFEPEQFKVWPDYRSNGNSPWSPGWVPPALPADGRFPVKVTFRTPGTFVVRVMAHDGGLQTTRDVTWTVKPTIGNP